MTDPVGWALFIGGIAGTVVSASVLLVLVADRRSKRRRP